MDTPAAAPAAQATPAAPASAPAGATPVAPAASTPPPVPSSSAAVPPGTPTPGAAAVPPWYNVLPEDIRNDPSITKYTSMDELAKGHVNAMKLIGRDKIPMPKTDQEFIETMRRLGAPDAKEKYQLGSERGAVFLKNDAEAYMKSVSPQFVDEFKMHAHNYGLTQNQAERLYDDYIDRMHSFEVSKQQQVKSEMEACGGVLRAQWGDAMQNRLQVADMALNKLFGADTAKKVAESGLGRDARFVMAMYEVGVKASEELGIDKRGNSTQTPGDLDGEIKQLMAHPAYFDPQHPEHKLVVAKVTGLYSRRYKDA